jgi:hypothetical protein
MHAALARWLPPDVGPETIMACVGLIADTHMPDRLAELPRAIFDVLRGVDLLLHAGDVGELRVLDELSVIAPLVAVHGNDETAEAQRELPYQQVIAIAGQRIVLTHAHYPRRHLGAKAGAPHGVWDSRGCHDRRLWPHTYPHDSPNR